MNAQISRNASSCALNHRAKACCALCSFETRRFSARNSVLWFVSCVEHAVSLEQAGILLIAHLHAVRPHDDALRRRGARCCQSPHRELRGFAALGVRSGQ